MCGNNKIGYAALHLGLMQVKLKMAYNCEVTNKSTHSCRQVNVAEDVIQD